MNFQNSISSKDFCKKNCGGCSKEKFFEEYYRILHTAYLRSNNSSCLDIIRNDFENSFGTDLDTASVSYIYATSKYLVYDVVVAALLSDGKIDSQYYFYKLIIELGFDVWLISALESGIRLTMNDFYKWLPLPKNEKTERAVSDFWHFRLPKAHKFSHLYDGIKQYKRDILITYRRLLLAKNDVILDVESVNQIVRYIDGLIPRKKNPVPATKTVSTHIDTVEAISVPVKENIPETHVFEPSETSTEEQPDIVFENKASDEIPETPVVTIADEVSEASSVQLSDELFFGGALKTAENIADEISGEGQEIVSENSINPEEMQEITGTIQEIAEEVQEITEETKEITEETQEITEEIADPSLNYDGIKVDFPVQTVEQVVDFGNALENVAVAATVVAVSNTVEEETTEAGDICKNVEENAEPVDMIEEIEFDDAPVLPDNVKEIELVLAEEEPVPEKPEIVEEKEETRAEIPAESINEKTPVIKVVNPADYIPFKQENRDFASDRSRNVVRNVENSLKSDKSGKGFKKNCHEVTKDKLVTAAVCVGIASVLLVPLAITCFGKKGKRK